MFRDHKGAGTSYILGIQTISKDDPGGPYLPALTLYFKTTGQI